MKIWKFFVVPSAQPQVIMMPGGAQILSAHGQFGHICLWAIVDPSAPLAPRTIEVCGTGWDMEQRDRRFIGTALIDVGSLVFHVFEVTT